MKKTNIIIIVLVLILAIIYIVSKSTSDTKDIPVGPVTQTETPIEDPTDRQLELTQEQARALVTETWGDCDSDTCGQLVVTTEKKGDGVYDVIAVYDKLYDDSVAAEKRVAEARYIDDVWVLGEYTMTHSCQKGRGHQDFTNELCV
jgi:hypothetical protein